MHYFPHDHNLSWEQYLDLEARSDERFEYHDGVIVAMSGATNRHNQIIGNLFAPLHKLLAGKGCRVFSETVRLFRYRSEKYLYPDLMVTCNPLDLQTKNGARSPLLTIEVLSKTNTHKQLAFKLRAYFQIPSLIHYLMVDQEECLVQHYRKNEQGLFELSLFDQIDQVIEISELGTSISLADLYQGIEFGPEVTAVEEAAMPYETYHED